MTQSTIVKFLIPFLFAVAIALSIIQHAHTTRRSDFILHGADSHKGLADYYAEAQLLGQSSTQTTVTTTVTFLATGDIMLARNVAATIQKSGDADLPFRSMAEILKSTDFNFANLESPFTQDKSAIIGGHSLIFAAPASYSKGLSDYNFSLVNVANNHALDQGLTGLTYTNAVLDQNNINHVGTGQNFDQAWKPAYVTVHDIRVCFVGASFSSLNDGGRAINNYVARIENTDRLKREIENLKSSCNFIVATMHAGTEYTRAPNPAQKAFAHAAIDAGADLVIGAHPHWIQTIERYCPGNSTGLQHAFLSQKVVRDEHLADSPETACSNPKYIFYSLGNFIFDQEWSQETKEGLTLKITLSKQTCNVATRSKLDSHICAQDLQGSPASAHIESIQLIPVIIENYSTPRPATENEAKIILNKIGEPQNVLKYEGKD